MAEVLVSARSLSRSYHTEAGSVEALRGVDIDIARGEIVAVLGPSGCGKTTLLNCLAGIDLPTEGTVTFDGRMLHELDDTSRTELRAHSMGFVFQAFNLVNVLTARENVELPLLLAGRSAREARDAALSALDRVGLAERSRHLPAELSGGEQQRVALARSLVAEPAIVWADEPTGNLDAANGKRVLDLMSQLNEGAGQTYVIVTHDTKVRDIAHRIITMESGRIIGEEPGGGATR